MIRNQSRLLNRKGTSRRLDNLQRSSPLRAEWRFLSVSVRWLERNRKRKKSISLLGLIKEKVPTSLRLKGHQIWAMQTHWRGYRTEQSLNKRLKRKRSWGTPLSFVAGIVFPKKTTIHLRRQRWIAPHHSVQIFASNRETLSLEPSTMSLGAEQTVQQKITWIERKKARAQSMTSSSGHAPNRN